MIHLLRIIIGWVAILISLFIITSGDPLALEGILGFGSPILILLTYWVGWLTINGILWLGIRFVQLVFIQNRSSAIITNPMTEGSSRLNTLTDNLEQELKKAEHSLEQNKLVR